MQLLLCTLLKIVHEQHTGLTVLAHEPCVWLLVQCYTNRLLGECYAALSLVDHLLVLYVVQDTTPRTLAMRALNELIASDNRVQAVTLPVGDGVAVCRRLH